MSDRRRAPAPRWRRAAAAAGAAVIVLVAAGAVWAHGRISPSGPPGAAVSVEIPSGTSTRGITRLLAERGVISDSWLFLVYLKVHGAGPFQAGVYTLHRHEPYGQVVHDLSVSGAQRLVVPEGFTLRQIADRVATLPGHTAAHFLQVAASGVVTSRYQPPGSTNLEGLLFPDTYRVNPSESDGDILATMVHRFDTVAAGTGLDRAAASVGVSPYQAVIVASMVEREAKLAEDRGLVAQVVYNRLRRGMRLQVDATVLYALGGARTTLTSADLAVASPYNTYQVTGLPPAPIACPGRLALTAALQPPPGDYLYYVVVRADGKEAFSSSLAGQEANIRLARERGLG